MKVSVNPIYFDQSPVSLELPRYLWRELADSLRDIEGYVRTNLDRPKEGKALRDLASIRRKFEDLAIAPAAPKATDA